jgi:hypothetical protein
MLGDIDNDGRIVWRRIRLIKAYLEVSDDDVDDLPNIDLKYYFQTQLY